MNEALGKAILKMLGMKNPPKLKNEFKEKVPQFILDEYNKQVDESVGKGKEKKNRVMVFGHFKVKVLCKDEKQNKRRKT